VHGVKSLPSSHSARPKSQQKGPTCVNLDVVINDICIYEEAVQYIPQVSFAELETLSKEQLNTIKQRGCVVIRDVVDDAEAASWKTLLHEYIAQNPDAKGIPQEDKQFFML
jgi:hypothetical protein